MEKKNLRKTEGLPFTLGMAGGVVLLLGKILSYSLNPVITSATYSALKIQAPATDTGAGGLIQTFASFLVMPGIFLILLTLGKNREKRGSAFAVAWIVIAVLLFLMETASQLFLKGILNQIVAAVDTVMPGGYWILYGLDLLGSALIVASCAVFLGRLRQPPILPGTENGQPNGDPPSSQP